MVSLKEQEDLFKLIGEKLEERVECFVIGGSAMLYHGTKNATKDIDLVFLNEGIRAKIIKILKDLGFRERDTRFIYIKKKNIPILLQRGEERIDLFSKKIICFDLTESMINRVYAVYEYNNFIIKIMAPEDIILLKCATERAGDRLDASEILKKHEIKWDILIKESINQTKEGQEIFPVFLYDFLLELKEDLKADIPDYVIKEIMKIGEKEMIKRLKK